MSSAPCPEFYQVDPPDLDVNLHPGQARAWLSEKRFIAIIAGSQSGKTIFGPWWLLREMQRRGPGDYLIVTPTFQILERKALPALKWLFNSLKLGEYLSSPTRRYTISAVGEEALFGEMQREPTTVWFGYAEDPESLESATVKAAWLDEAGQKKFRLASWEAIQRRLAIHQGRALITTTPYDLGWLKQKLWDPWKNGDTDVQVVNFDSTQNPAFPPEEWERAKRVLPAWKFALFYQGIFSRPAGMIYDAFNDWEGERPEGIGHKCKRRDIPDSWPRFCGIDFGQVNTAAVFLANEPGTPRYYLYRTYHTGGRSTEEHAAALLKHETIIPTAYGGSRSEDVWRAKFQRSGLTIHEPPINDVEAGIDAVYAMHKENQIIVFDDLEEYLEEKLTYSRVLDMNGEPTIQIEDKHAYHLMDAERYLATHLRHSSDWSFF